MKILIVEDNFPSSQLLQKYLEPYGDCDVAIDGREALDAFEAAWEENEPYDLICLDIMMPEMDGHEALKRIRKSENQKGIEGNKGVKVIMTTALSDHKHVVEAFKEHCDAYLVKPIEKDKLIGEIKGLGLIEG